ncbi:recombinase family protein [Mesorhizobium sp. M0243]|uniref:recombinase family protein n=1 Tax=Mesorhizobium sp. M0243 TaxID=2956925 RepID=UPI003337F274
MKLPVVRTGLIPAAQYLRMSTEHQRYSLDNQSAGIAAYAKSRGYEIVETYKDAGRSGLTLRGRAALKQLLSDVMGGKSPYDVVLVLDISRWGRFQDVDQSAHYEFLCREAGVSVAYCAEAFENDGSAASAIVKQIKRVMAAEYSRELSRKVSRAQRQQARLGFKQGGDAPYGTRRQLIDEGGIRRMILEPGERKALITDRVILTHGPKEETDLVRRIFQMFVDQKMRLAEIEKALASEGRTSTRGGDWSLGTIRNLLSNEIYIGRYVFGRQLNNLGRPFKTLPETWSRSEMMEPIISLKLFKAAARRLKEITRVRLSDQDLHDGLTRLYAEHGRLTYSLVHDCPYLPLPQAVRKRYGSLYAAYLSVGYEMPTRWKLNADGKPYTDEDLLNVLRRIYAKHGHPTAAIINEDLQSPTARYFIRRFGGLTNAFHMAGFGEANTTTRRAASLRNQRERHERGERRSAIRHNEDGSRITDEQLLDHLRRLMDQHGHLSGAVIDADPTLPSSKFFRRRLGGLKAAYARVGYLSDQSAIVKAALKRLSTQAANDEARESDRRDVALYGEMMLK